MFIQSIQYFLIFILNHYINYKIINKKKLVNCGERGKNGEVLNVIQ